MPRWPKRTPRHGVDEYGRTPLWYRAFEGDLAGVQRELAAGADPNIGDDAGYTPLHAAVQERRVKVVEFLLEHGANPNQADAQGNLPIWSAVLYANREGNPEILKLLLRAGTDAKRPNKAGRSPFQLALEIGYGVEKFFADSEGEPA